MGRRGGGRVTLGLLEGLGAQDPVGRLGRRILEVAVPEQVRRFGGPRLRRRHSQRRRSTRRSRSRGRIIAGARVRVVPVLPPPRVPPVGHAPRVLAAGPDPGAPPLRRLVPPLHVHPVLADVGIGQDTLVHRRIPRDVPNAHRRRPRGRIHPEGDATAAGPESRTDPEALRDRISVAGVATRFGSTRVRRLRGRFAPRLLQGEVEGRPEG
mmetsp:Transcript_35037/g.104497  ORF Transcript_35037/g.104497 Transcript_35037/m.104497 type:complete len:210 (+) Transcript_35037:79-708(+)